MSCIHYKFKSSLEYDTLTFDGLHITLGDLKKLITLQKKLGKSLEFDLQITNAQTKEVYKNDDDLIPKNTSIIVSRIPVGATSKAVGTAIEIPVPSEGELSFAMDSGISFEQLSRTSDLAAANASEDDKIRAMMAQSTKDYDQSNYVKSKYPVGNPNKGYLCYRCYQPGHFIGNCPHRGSDLEMPKVRRSTGIPQSFMKVVDNPNVQGAMMTSNGQFAVPWIDDEAYRTGKKEKPPFLQSKKAESVPAEDKSIPGELLCLLCKDLLKEAVVIQCCGNSFCDECIREKLLETDEHKCPQCGETGVSPDSLIPNAFLRKLVTNFENETGYIKPRRRSSSGSVGQTPPATPTQAMYQQTNKSHMHQQGPQQYPHQHQPRNPQSPWPQAPGNSYYHQQRQQLQQQHQHQQHQQHPQHPSQRVPQPGQVPQQGPGPVVNTPPQAQPAAQQHSQSMAIPAHLIGLPPHVIKAEMRALEAKGNLHQPSPAQPTQQQQQQQQPQQARPPQQHQQPAAAGHQHQQYPGYQPHPGQHPSAHPAARPQGYPQATQPTTQQPVSRQPAPQQPQSHPQQQPQAHHPQQHAAPQAQAQAPTQAHPPQGQQHPPQQQHYQYPANAQPGHSQHPNSQVTAQKPHTASPGNPPNSGYPAGYTSPAQAAAPAAQASQTAVSRAYPTQQHASQGTPHPTVSIAAANRPADSSMSVAPQTPSTPTVDEPRQYPGGSTSATHQASPVPVSGVSPSVTTSSLQPRPVAPSHSQTAVPGQTPTTAPSHAQTPPQGQVNSASPATSTATSHPRPATQPHPAAHGPQHAPHPGAPPQHHHQPMVQQPQPHQAQMPQGYPPQPHPSQVPPNMPGQGYARPQQQWPNPQPRPAYPQSVHPGYAAPAGIGPGPVGMAPRHGQPAPHMPPGMMPGIPGPPMNRGAMPGFRGPPPPGMVPNSGPPPGMVPPGMRVGPPGGRLLTKEEFYREKQRLLREKEEKERREREREKERIHQEQEKYRLEQERIRIEQEKKKQRDLDSFAQDFIDGKNRPKKTVIPPSRSRSRSTSRPRSRPRSTSRPRSRPRSTSRPRSRPRSTSRPRSRPRSTSRPRSRSKGRSRSRSRTHSRSPYKKPKSRSRTRSRSRARSPKRSSRSISRSRSRSRLRQRTRSRTRSRSRPRSRSRSRSPLPRRKSPFSRSRSWSRTPPPRAPFGRSPRRSRGRSWSRTPPPRYARRDRTPERYMSDRYLKRSRSRTPSPPYRGKDLSPGHRRNRTPPPPSGWYEDKRYRHQYSPSRNEEYQRNRDRYDPRWAEYYRQYYEWCERYGDHMNYPTHPHPPTNVQPRAARRSYSRSPSPYFSKTGKYDTRSPPRARYSPSPKPRSPPRADNFKRTKGRDYEYEGRRMEPQEKKSRVVEHHKAKKKSRDKSKESKEKRSKEKERESEKEKKLRKSKKAKKTSSGDVAEKENQSGLESSGTETSTTKRESRDLREKLDHDTKRISDLPPVTEEQVVEPLMKGFLTKDERLAHVHTTQVEEKERVQKLKVEEQKMEEEMEANEPITTLSVQREPCPVEDGKYSKRKREVIEIKMETYEDGDTPPATNPDAKPPPNDKGQDSDETVAPSKKPKMEPNLRLKIKSKKTKVKDEPRGQERGDVPKNSEQSSKPSTPKESDHVKIIKPKYEAPKSKMPAPEPVVSKKDKLKESGLLVEPPELSRWEREDSGQDSDNRDAPKSRLASRISKPKDSLPKHVLESAEKAIIQKPRGVVSVASAVSTVPPPSKSTSRKVILDPDRERSPVRSASTEAKRRKVTSDQRSMQVTISSGSEKSKERRSSRDQMETKDRDRRPRESPPRRPRESPPRDMHPKDTHNRDAALSRDRHHRESRTSRDADLRQVSSRSKPSSREHEAYSRSTSAVDKKPKDKDREDRSYKEASYSSSHRSSRDTIDKEKEKEKPPQKIKLKRDSARDSKDSKTMLPPKPSKTRTSSDGRDSKTLDRKLSVMDESKFEPDYEEEDLEDEAMSIPKQGNSIKEPRHSDGASSRSPSPETKQVTKRNRDQKSPSRSPSPASEDKDGKSKHKKKHKKHKHHKKHKKHKNKEKEKTSQD